MTTVEEQIQLLRQQMAQLQAQVNLNHSADDMQTTPTQSGEDTAPLHFLGTRPHYDWTPSEFHSNLMNMTASLHTTPMIPDSERKAIIESYPPLAGVEYRAPANIPTAERLTNKGQKVEDHSLKHHQYRLSAIFRPLDVLCHEMLSAESENPNLERYMTMLKYIRRLLLDFSAGITQSRNNIALRAVNSSFSMKSDNDTHYTLPLDDFQATLIQQTAAKKATRDAS